MAPRSARSSLRPRHPTRPTAGPPPRCAWSTRAFSRPSPTLGHQVQELEPAIDPLVGPSSYGARLPRGGSMLGIDEWLGTLPPLMILLVVGAIILAESMGIPLPGEITLISASLLAATGTINIWGVALAASIGAIVGDSIGY